jgi:Family of unknown function (DUF6159)
VLGGAWSLLTIFAIPVLALEGCSAPQCVRRSAGLVRHRWGEGVAGNVVITSAFVVASMVPAMMLGAGVAILDIAPAAGAALAIAGGTGIIVVIAGGSAVHGVFSVALHRYAVDRVATGGFPARELHAPFTKKRRRLLRRRRRRDRD